MTIQGRSHLLGILLAAGRGRRMGQTKQVLPWPPSHPTTTLVAAAFDALSAHVHRMMVVLGHEADAVRSVLTGRTYEVVLADPDAEMVSSIRVALSAALQGQELACLLHPADQPRIQAATVDAILKVGQELPDMAVMPEHQGRGGHPVLIPRSMWPEILRFDGEGGLRQFWLDRHTRCRRVPVPDSSVYGDIDTPTDLLGELSTE